MSDESAKGTFLLKEKDFVEWVDAEGNPLPPVPKHWGADQMPAGATKKSKAAKSSSGSSDDKVDKDAEPKGNASADDWAAWAKRVKNATDDDLKDADGEPLKRDEIRAKFGTPPAS
jgi:hypothetical protein